MLGVLGGRLSPLGSVPGKAGTNKPISTAESSTRDTWNAGVLRTAIVQAAPQQFVLQWPLP
jgi:hypothetical protein